MTERRCTANKHTSERNAVAAHIRNIRSVERAGQYQTSRNDVEYLNAFGGLRHFFSYVRSVPGSQTVLDIGAGTTLGISQIAKSDIAEGLEVYATGLHRSPDVQNNLGEERFRITSAEVLRGIEDNSVAGILALFSIAYSESPEMAIERMDEVLVPGGVIKAVFPSEVGLGLSADFYRRTRCKPHYRYTEALKKSGYDVALGDSGQVLLAIKSGTNTLTSAQILLSADKSALAGQLVGRRLQPEPPMFPTLPYIHPLGKFVTAQSPSNLQKYESEKSLYPHEYFSLKKTSKVVYENELQPASNSKHYSLLSDMSDKQTSESPKPLENEIELMSLLAGLGRN